MRRDAYLQNDSGALSVIAAARAEEIIEDGRENDLRFVEEHAAMLLLLYGDDSLPVRVVVDEELTADEQEQWLARVGWRIDAPDGRLLVMGGFDPDVINDWLQAGAQDADGWGVAPVDAGPGSWRVDLYAHVGSMNGRNILDEGGEPIGAAFRKSHPGRAFPLWLAQALAYMADQDPGHEEAWRDVAASLERGDLEIDTETASFVGFLIHLTPFDGDLPPLPEDGWFDWNEGARVPDTLPVGLPAEAADPGLEGFRDRILGRD